MMRLHLGCGTNHLPGWVNVDFNPNYSPDVLDDVMRLSKFDKGCADEILAEHVLEHLPLNGSLIALNRWREVLKIGGKLTIEVPDLKRACFEFLECQDFDPAPESILNRYPNLHRILNNQGDTWFYRGWGRARNFFGSQDYPGQFHLSGWWKEKLVNELEKRGFKIISAMESFEFTDSSERKALGFSGHSEEEPCLRVVAERKE